MDYQTLLNNLDNEINVKREEEKNAPKRST